MSIAGIPDFRTPGTGLYSNLKKYNLPFPEAVFDVGFYQRNPQPFVTLAHELWPGLQHSPTKTHSFLSLLSKKGLLLRNYSQNIDGLEFLAGIPAEELVECHGHFRTGKQGVGLFQCRCAIRRAICRLLIKFSFRYIKKIASCIDCGKEANAEIVKDEIVKEAKVPICKYCSANVKPDIVFFGESLPDRFHKLLKKDVKQADLLIGKFWYFCVFSHCVFAYFAHSPSLLGSFSHSYGNLTTSCACVIHTQHGTVSTHHL